MRGFEKRKFLRGFVSEGKFCEGRLWRIVFLRGCEGIECFFRGSEGKRVFVREVGIL